MADVGPQVEERAGAYAVIGAGMSGLASLKALLEAGFDADCYERESEVGGNWNIDARNSRIYRSIHLISSRPFTQYPDFPMPDSFADYPSHTEVLGYFKRYADHFGLREHIAFDHDVLRVEPVDGGARWDVTAEGPDGVARTRRYDGVLIANGHNWSPKMPTYEGLDAFGGTVLHSKDYKDSDVLRGKRVLIVGGGNTGCDLAVEGAQNAAATYHSTRRGYYYNPKFVGGRPSDQVNDTLLLLRIPLAVRRLMYKTTLRATVGSFDKLGLQKPDHEFGETHPVANSLLAYYLGHGDIQPKPEIRRFTAEGVEFTDGTSARRRRGRLLHRLPRHASRSWTTSTSTPPTAARASTSTSSRPGTTTSSSSACTSRTPAPSACRTGRPWPRSATWRPGATARRRRGRSARRWPPRPTGGSPAACASPTRRGTTSRSPTRTSWPASSRPSTSWRARDERRFRPDHGHAPPGLGVAAAARCTARCSARCRPSRPASRRCSSCTAPPTARGASPSTGCRPPPSAASRRTRCRCAATAAAAARGGSGARRCGSTSTTCCRPSPSCPAARSSSATRWAG